MGCIVGRRKKKYRFSETVDLVLSLLPHDESEYKLSGDIGSRLFEIVGYWRDMDLPQAIKVYQDGDEIKVGLAEGSKVLPCILDSSFLQKEVKLGSNDYPDWLCGEWDDIVVEVLSALEKLGIPIKSIIVLSSSNAGYYLPYRNVDGEYSMIFF